MPKPCPQEFRDDVVKVARSRGDGVTLEQIAADFGIHPMTLSGWMRKTAISEGERPGVTSAESAELREAKRRVCLLEQENDVSARSGSRSVLPLARDASRRQSARRGVSRERDPRRAR